MSDAAPPLQFAEVTGDPAGGPLAPEQIERALADLRDWLTTVPSANGPLEPVRESVDLHTLVGQFVALRHEVNLQTKAARAALDQNAAALERLDEALDALRAPAEDDAESEPEPEPEDLRPLFKALIDAFDVLALSMQQVERQKATIESGLKCVLEGSEWEAPPEGIAPAPRPGFWSRLFGSQPVAADNRAWHEWRERAASRAREREERVRTAVQFVRQAVDGLLTGYAMSLGRIERILPQFGIDRIPCLGQRFDPELMEVCEVVADSGKPAGEVLAEVRRGYYYRNAIFRYAQVKVAK